MAVAVAVIFKLLLSMHTSVKALGGLLIALQIIWGSDVYFFTTHGMIGSPVLAAVELINTSRNGNFDKRFDVFEDYKRAGEATPPGSVILAHEYAPTLGLLRRRVSDRPGAQGGIYYSRMHSNAEVYQTLRSMGVTHVFWRPPEGADTLAADLVFHGFTNAVLRDSKNYGGWRLAPLPSQPPAEVRFRRKVAYLGCPTHGYLQGLYSLQALDQHPSDAKTPRSRPERRLKEASDASDIVPGADFLVLERSCSPALEARLMRAFQRVATRRSQDLFVRR